MDYNYKTADDLFLPTITRNTYFLYCVTVVLLVLNGLNNPFLNTIALMMVLILIFKIPSEHSVLIYPIIQVFFGFSNISMDLIGGVYLDNSTLQALFCLLLVVKIALKYGIREIHYERRDSLFLIMMIVFSLNRLLTIKFTRMLAFSAEAIIIYQLILMFRHKEKRIRDYTFLFSICVIGESFYGKIFNYNVGEWGWRALQLSGMSDPNNFALNCCMIIALVLVVLPKGFSKKEKVFLCIASSIGVMLSISFSGMSLCLSLFLCQIMFGNAGEGTNKTASRLIASFLILIVFVSFVSFLPAISELAISSNISAISAIGQRLSGMVSDLLVGDYNGFSSGRLVLSSRYMNAFSNYNIIEMVVGNAGNIGTLETVLGHASHNSYIDILISYGLLGIVLFILYAINIFYSYIKNNEWKSLAVAILFLIVAYSRTMSISNLCLYINI